MISAINRQNKVEDKDFMISKKLRSVCVELSKNILVQCIIIYLQKYEHRSIASAHGP